MFFVAYGYARLLLSTSDEQQQFWKNWCIGKLIKNLSKRKLALALSGYAKLVKPLIRTNLLKHLCERTEAGENVLVVTASFENAVADLLIDQGFIVLGSMFAYDGITFSDETLKPDCFGDGKVLRIRDWVQSTGFECYFTEAWSDSLSDIPMMKLAEEQVWVCSKEKNAQFSAIFPTARFWNV